MNWSSIFCMAWTRTSLTMQMTSGVDVFSHVSRQKADTSTSSNCCDNIQPHDETFQLLSNVTPFLDCFFFGNYHKFERLNFARYCGNILKVWWEMSCGFCWKFTSLSSFHQWNNFENLLRIDKSYCHEFGVLLFWDTVYIVIQTAKLKIYSQYRQSFYRPIQLYFYLAVNLLDKF